VKKTFGSFAEMINDSDVPVLVDMYANWCGPCKLLAPILEEVSSRLGGPAVVQVVKVDTEKYPQVASLFAVSALPTLILFKKGQPVHRLEGLPTADDLVARLRPHLS
jgi:thioredoxin